MQLQVHKNTFPLSKKGVMRAQTIRVRSKNTIVRVDLQQINRLLQIIMKAQDL